MTYASAWDSGQGPFEDNSEPALETNAKRADGSLAPPGHYISVHEIMLFGYQHIATTPLNNGSYVLKNDYEFTDCMDGEVFQLKQGDKLFAYRVSK